jgi:hypothetical protein
MANPININNMCLLENLKKHWCAISADFSASYADCHAAFDAITHSLSPVIEAVAPSLGTNNPAWQNGRFLVDWLRLVKTG